jgi:NADH-quinone oxidoreductase subunit L
MVFVTFFGEEKTHVGHSPGPRITIPLVVLAVLSLVGGFIELPQTLGHLELFSDFLRPVFPAIDVRPGATTSTEWLIQGTTIALSFIGIFIAYYFYLAKPHLANKLKSSIPQLHQIWFSGWGFDALYDALIVRPYAFLAKVNKNDVVDKLYSLVVSITDLMHRLFARTQGGILRWYIMSMVIGAILILTLGLLL